MLDTHVYEVLPGEVLFRRSGNGTRGFMRCTVVRTRARAMKFADIYRVDVSLLVTGSQTLEFDDWFDDWTVQDDMGRSRDMQSGRPIDVAIPTDMFDKLVRTGDYSSQHMIQIEASDRYAPFGAPLVAVRIGDRWVEPRPTFDMSHKLSEQALPRRRR